MKKMALFISLSFVVLSGCVDTSTGVNGSSSYDGTSYGDMKSAPIIKRFEVSGRSDQAVFSTNSTSSIEWAVNYNNNYHVSLYLSPDSKGDIKEKEIYARNCGPSLEFISHCSSSGDVICSLNSDNALSCGDDSTLYQNMRFDTNNAKYLVLKTCNALFTNCDKKSIPVIFQ